MTENLTETNLLSDYRKTVSKLGIFVAVCFFMHFAAGIAIEGLYRLIGQSVSDTVFYIIELSVSALFLQIACSVTGALMFGYIGPRAEKGQLAALYEKPRKLLKAVSNFAPAYGASQLTNYITMIVIFIFSRGVSIDKAAITARDVLPSDLPSAFFMFFMLIVIGPVFEEFMFRGIVLRALAPYGNGLAIIASGVLFGLFHGNFRQVFYAAVFGIVLGYIANATDSLLPTTIIHAIVNGMSGIILIFTSTDSVQKLIFGTLSGDISPDRLAASITEKDMIINALYVIYGLCLFVFTVIGIITAIIKLRKIKSYKVPKVCPELGNGKKTLILLTTPASIIALLLIIFTFADSTFYLSARIFG